MKRLLSIFICVSVLLSFNIAFAAASNDKQSLKKIPTRMSPGTIITYDDKLNPIISIDPPNRSTLVNNSTELADKEGRAAEDEYVATIRESAKNLPVVKLEEQLPTPVPGMVVIYGSDGLINRIYPDNVDISASANFDETKTLPYPSRLPAGTYTYGTNQTITITSSTVLGEGRFTVYRAGVGGSGTIGSSGKTLGTGDVATKKSVDNAKHGTALTARALDTDIVKTVYKNDIGSLPDAVLDVYFWGWTAPFFGYMYSDTLSFPGRYFYPGFPPKHNEAVIKNA